MNKRIRKKKDKQQLILAIRGIVAIADEREQRKQAAIQRFVKECEKLYEKNKARQSF